MKILSLHVDYIKFKPLKKAIRKIEDLKDLSEKKVDQALAVLTAVEKGDSDVKSVVSKLVSEIEKIAEQVNVKNVVLYPYAHLSSNLSSPELAIEVLDRAEEALAKKFNVSKAPFGYYKEFEMKVKGHPLSELSREIEVEGIEGTQEYDPKKLLREVSKNVLDTSKLKENDHRILGQQMDLYSFSPVAPGMVFWHNNGLIIRNELIDFWREVHRKSGYKEVSTPQVMDKKLWQISGHWDKYAESNFSTEYEGRQFLVKPMNCPGGMLIFKNRPKSYRDLPLKVGELGTVHRVELSGVLAGLFRVIQFTQDDAHIFCTEKQLEEEVVKIMDLIDMIYKKFGFNYRMELSTRPEKRIGSDKVWDKSEKALKNVLDKKGVKYKINKGDGAFYGPKIDFHLKDSLNREWQCGTIQLDFSMPERFEVEYTDKDNKKKRPVMLHRTVFGSLERFMGILIEHTSGRLPTWLAPMQVRVLSFTDRNEKYAREVIKKIGDAVPGVRIDVDFTQTGIPSKVKEAEIMRIPYILTVGDREEKDGKLAVRVRGNKKLESFDIEEFISKLKKEIEERV